MSMEIVYNPAHRLVRVTACGSYGLAAVAGALAQLHAAQLPHDTAVLWDLRAATPLLRSLEVQQLVELTKQRVGSIPRRAAVVTDSLLIYGLHRMAQTYLEIRQVPVTLETFRTLEEALHWLGVSGATSSGG